MNDMNIAISQLSVAKPNNMTVSLLTKGEDNQSVALDRKKFFRKKYKLALQLYAKLDMVAYAQTHSEWGAKDVLAEIVKDYDKDLPSKILLEMAAYIIAEWEKIRASKDYTPEQKAEIGTAIEESYNPKNWIAHEEVLKKYEWLKR